MKKKLLVLGMVVALVAALVMPTAAMATTTDVTGDVISGYTFTPPSALPLGAMSPAASPKLGNSVDGRLDGNNTLGYTVTGTDAKVPSKGFMVSGADVLGSKLKIGPAASPTALADTVVSFVDTSAPTGADIALYVSQIVAYTDTVAAGYTITITFTVTAK